MHKYSSSAPVIVGSAIIVLIVGAVVASFIQPDMQAVDTTASPQAVATTTGPVASSTLESTWPRYTNQSLGYTIQYEPTLTVAENLDYNPAPDVALKVTKFTFPTSAHEGGTTRDAKIYIARTNMECSIWIDGESSAPVTATKNINNFAFEIREMNDAGLSNFYRTIEYSTVRNSQCYRLQLLIHSTSPSVQFESEEEINSAIEANNQIEQELVTVFEQMIETFEFASQ